MSRLGLTLNKTPILVPSSANGGQMIAFEEMLAICDGRLMMQKKEIMFFSEVTAKQMQQENLCFETTLRLDIAIPYRAYLPNNYSEKGTVLPLLFLHGAGERGSDLEVMARLVSRIIR